jgi:hypothetical protein
MNIQYYGLTCFRFCVRPGGRSTEEVVLYIDPIEGESGMKGVYGRADLVLLTAQEKKHTLSLIKGSPKVISMPGECAYKQMTIIGFEGEDDKENKRGEKTAYLIEMEDIKCVHLGTSASLPQEAISQFSGCDILMIPVGGRGAYDAKQAAAITRLIEPKVIIPMYYQLPNYTDLEAKEVYYRELAVKDTEILEKFVCKAKELNSRSMDIVELEAKR